MSRLSDADIEYYRRLAHDIQNPILHQFLDDREAILAEVERLQGELSAVQKELKLLPLYRRGANWSGQLFCWAVENLTRFPQMEGTANDEFKRRLLNEEKLQAELAACRIELAEAKRTISQYEADEYDRQMSQ